MYNILSNRNNFVREIVEVRNMSFVGLHCCFKSMNMFTELQHFEPARWNHPQMSDIFTFVVFSGHLSYCQYINFNTDVQNASIKVKQQRF